MAQQLKERHHLLTLKVSLRFNVRPAEVWLELERLESGKNTIDNRWRLSVSELGAPGEVSNATELKLTIPPAVLGPMVEEVHRAATDPEEPLWLHLSPPYGCLGGFDWEGVLIAALGRPVLRLPDFLERQREDDRTLEAVLICDLPGDEPPFPVGPTLLKLSAWPYAARRAATRLHVFVSSAWRGEVNSALAGRDGVLLYDAPSDPGTDWLDWVERSVMGVSIDAAHFVVPGYFVSQQPALVLTQSPSLSCSEASGLFLSPIRVADFLTRIGAWASVYSAPPRGRVSPIRSFADALAQARPGPALFHDMDQADWEQTLRQWTEFLFSSTPMEPPMRAGAFAYCQPHLVEGVKFKQRFRSRAAPEFELPLQAAIELSGPDQGSWVSSAERFRESAVQQQRSWSADAAASGAPSKKGFRASDVLADSISELDQILAAHMRRGDKP